MRNLNEEQQERVQGLDVESLAKCVFRYMKDDPDSEPDDRLGNTISKAYAPTKRDYTFRL